MRKLTENEIVQLQSCKGIKDGNLKFFDVLEDIYKDDDEAIKEIMKHKEILLSLDDLKQYPGVYPKTKNMYYDFMDDFLHKIGYHK